MLFSRKLWNLKCTLKSKSEQTPSNWSQLHVTQKGTINGLTNNEDSIRFQNEVQFFAWKLIRVSTELALTQESLGVKLAN